MRQTVATARWWTTAMTAAALMTLAMLAVGTVVVAARGDEWGFGRGDDFGVKVEQWLQAHAEELVGIRGPLRESALGPFGGANQDALVVASGLTVTVVSNATEAAADMIALWPDETRPTHLFVCVENGGGTPTTVSVQRVRLGADPNGNAETIVKGLASCDPIHRTPWGTLVVAEEAGATGGLYEIFDPLSIPAASPIVVVDRANGITTDPTHMTKRRAVGSLSFEGIALLADGTMYYGDENRPTGGRPGGAIYKFVPTSPHTPGRGPIGSLAESPLVAGSIFGMRLGTNAGNTDYGQGSEIGVGVWVPINGAAFTDASGNIILRNAQLALSLTGYYRPEDMDRDPIATAQGAVRVCWANTGRMTNGGGSVREGAANHGEVLCLIDEPLAGASTGAAPVVERFIADHPHLAMPDNVAFQPHTGNLVVLEDGEVEVVKADGTTELRGNDLWMCLPDGADHDVMSDGCVRIASLRDTDSEPTGFIFDASGENAYVNLQHRVTRQGALLKISGFKIPR
jgi:hypothetical protein